MRKSHKSYAYVLLTALILGGATTIGGA